MAIKTVSAEELQGIAQRLVKPVTDSLQAELALMREYLGDSLGQAEKAVEDAQSAMLGAKETAGNFVESAKGLDYERKMMHHLVDGFNGRLDAFGKRLDAALETAQEALDHAKGNTATIEEAKAALAATQARNEAVDRALEARAGEIERARERAISDLNGNMQALTRRVEEMVKAQSTRLEAYTGSLGVQADAALADIRGVLREAQAAKKAAEAATKELTVKFEAFKEAMQALVRR